MKKIKKEYYFIGVLLAVFILLTTFVLNGRIDILDAYVFNNVIKLKSEFITKFLYVITSMASTIGIIILLILMLIIFAKKKKLTSFKYVIGNVSLGVILMQVLKHIIKRPRPVWKWIKQGGFSYPSGHTISAVLLYGTLILLINKKYDGKYKKLFIFISILMIILTGISRIYFGVHYLTDVLASIVLGTIILLISNLLMNKEFDNNDKNKGNKTI